MTAHAMTLLVGLMLGGDGATKKDLTALQGTWKPIYVVLNGKQLKEGFADDRLVVTKNKFELRTPKETMSGTLTLDATKDPRHIETEITAGANKGLKSVGIYKLADGRLYVCYSVPPNPRPTEFTSDEGSSRALVVYVPVKE